MYVNCGLSTRSQIVQIVSLSSSLRCLKIQCHSCTIRKLQHHRETDIKERSRNGRLQHIDTYVIHQSSRLKIHKNVSNITSCLRTLLERTVHNARAAILDRCRERRPRRSLQRLLVHREHIVLQRHDLKIHISDQQPIERREARTISLSSPNLKLSCTT